MSISVRQFATSEPPNRWTSAARILLVAALLAAPLSFGAVQPWAWAALGMCTFAVVLLWGAATISSLRLSVLGTFLYVPLLLLSLLLVIQRAGNVTFDPISVRESIAKFVTYLLIFFLSRELFRNEPAASWSALGLAVTIYMFAVALFAILQFFSSPGLVYWSLRPLFGGIIFGPYVNHNHYAGLMEVLVPLSLGYLLTLPRGSARPVVGFVILVTVASVLLSGSRGGMVSLMAEFIVFALFLLREKGALMRERTVMVAVCSFMVAILVLFLWLDPGDVTKRLEQTASAPERSIADRKLYASDALRMFRDYPWLGVGAGSFEAAYPRYQTFSSDLVVNHAHNDYVEALAETGLCGALLILSAILLFLRQFFSLRPAPHGIGWTGIGAGVGCCGLLIHSFSDFNLHIPANAAWFAFAAGIATVSLRGRLHLKWEHEAARLTSIANHSESYS